MNHYTRRFTQAVMYKILSPILFDVDRILVLDADTLTFKDLSEIYNTELNDNYFI